MSAELNQMPRSIVLTREEIADICAPLQQSLAQVRFLQGLGLKVARRPDGSPLVSRQEFERAMSNAPAGEVDGEGPRWTVALPS